MMPDYLRLWAKTDKDKKRLYHPLLCHMLDVAAVAELVWDCCLSQVLQKRLECSLGADARSKVMFLAGSHDIGKASPGFQKRIPELSQNSGLPFSKNDLDRPHGFVTAYLLRKALGSFSASAVLSQIAGGHHGIFPRSSNLQLGVDTLGNKYWDETRWELFQKLAQAVGFDLKQTTQKEITDPVVVPTLAGFISVVDWIGSNQDFFPCVVEYGSENVIITADYWTKAQNQAQKALEKLGWLPAVVFAKEAKFDAVFKDFTPNPLQTAVIQLASKQNSPYLMIIEAPMGQGKTEAALYAADMAMCKGFARGMYIAMPTQATGNAMFKRVLNDYLRHRGHEGKLNLQLVHGDALLAQMAAAKEGEVPQFKPTSIGEDGNKDGDVEAQTWFTAKKRPFLAPFGVGTIDQSLLSVLQTRHWFVRLFGLAGKVVIFDEVHAYDAYMSTILERVLHWLAEADCTVILLSATLPETKRKIFVKTYSGRNDVEYKPYPRITLAGSCRFPDAQTGSAPLCAEIPMEEQANIKIRFSSTDLQTLITILTQQLKDGGCAAVICNTVDRSMEVYKHLKDSLKDTECLLFHARTLQKWRREREEDVLRKFGKGEKQADGTYANPHRPPRAVLVATQVIEQSLDLDFDLMFSEIAPIDLLLQRAGRLHRHLRNRPDSLKNPQFIVLCDVTANEPPPHSFPGGVEFIYERYILLLTLLILRKRDEIRIPKEIEELVESVYGGKEPDCGNEWKKALEIAYQKMEGDRLAFTLEARNLLVSRPMDPSDLIEGFNMQLLDDEDPKVHKTVKAATRLGAPSITVVMLPQDGAIRSNPDILEVRSLLDRSVKLGHRGIFGTLLDQQSPQEWSGNVHLRYSRLLKLNERNQGRVGNYLLTVDDELGVAIEKDGGENNG